MIAAAMPGRTRA